MRIRSVTLLLALAALQACGGDGPTGTGTPAALALAGGDQQTAAAGTPLPSPIEVRVTSAGGRTLQGVRVSFTLGEGSGFLTGASNTTDASGIARTGWTLGPAAGAQTLTVTVAPLPALTVRATAVPGAAAQVIPLAGVAQFNVVGQPVQNLPQARVADAFGNGLAGIVVTFSITAGTGTLTDSVQTSDAEGRATLGGWTLGRTAGNNIVRATIPGNFGADFVAIGTPAAIAVSAGDGQTANAGTLVPVPPSIVALDGEGQPLAGATVSWFVRSGGGRVAGATVTQSGPNGVAVADGWILGPNPGENALEAIVTGLDPIRFTATGVPGVPAAVAATTATEFDALAGNFLSELPEVRVLDAAGQPVFGVTVRFELTSGTGLVLNNTPTTDFDGRATLGVWRLGQALGPQGVRAVVEGLPPAQFTATAMAPPPSAFRIEVRFPDGQPSPAQQAAFDQAVARWQQAIIGDVPDVPLNIPAESFGCYPAMNETVDDLIIFARLVAIDGPGSILGQARPCLIRLGTNLTIIGLMQFDTADLPTLETNGTLNAVIMHEMGHVLGFFHFTWPANVATGLGGTDPFFRGTTARAAFLDAAGGAFSGNIVPLENVGGAGSRDSHWRESVFLSELMTSILSGANQPFSAVTISLFRDLGYVVNDAVADFFTLASAAQAGAGPQIPLVHGRLPGPIGLVDPNGRIRETIFP